MIWPDYSNTFKGGPEGRALSSDSLCGIGWWWRGGEDISKLSVMEHLCKSSAFKDGGNERWQQRVDLFRCLISHL